MRRYFSQPRKSIIPSKQTSEKDAETKPLHGVIDQESIDAESQGPTPVAQLTPPNLKIKRVDHYWSTWSKSWKYRNTGSRIIAEAVHPVGNGTDNDPWQNFCFVVVRKIPNQRAHFQLEQGPTSEITFQIVIKSPYLLKACRDVVGQVPGLSWTAEPLEVPIRPFLASDFARPHAD